MAAFLLGMVAGGTVAFAVFALLSAAKAQEDASSGSDSKNDCKKD